MKKLRLIAMFALTFALVFGAASCKNEEEGPWGESLAEVLKAEPKLDLSGTWEAFEGDVEFDYEDRESPEAMYLLMYEAVLPELNDKERAEIICEQIMKISSKIKSDGNEFAEMLVAEEDRLKKNKDENVTVLINGDRDQIKVEFEKTEKDGEGKNAFISTTSGYVTYEKK